MDAASMLPAVDSDDDDELAELIRPRSLRQRDSAHLVGREHPFSPMVNRLANSLSVTLSVVMMHDATLLCEIRTNSHATVVVIGPAASPTRAIDSSVQ